MGYAESQYIVDEVLSGISLRQSSGIPPKKAILSVTPIANGCQISVGLSDTVINNVPIVNVKGVELRIKPGSLPNNRKDGQFIGDFGLDELSSIEVNDLIYGEKYYVRAWPYSTHNVYNVDPDQSAYFTAIGEDNRVFGFHQDFTVLNPDESITYLGTNENYLPMNTITDDASVEYTMGSWDMWLWMVRNRPYLVNADGTKKVELDPDDYTKTIDEVDSNIGIATSYGGAFAWIPKIYMKEEYAEDGNSRDVYFCMEQLDGFQNVGFTDKNGDEVEGIWLPMFYPLTTGQVALTGTIKSSLTRDGISDFLSEYSYANPVCFGGPLYNCIRDILYMMYKTTDITKKAGYGSSGDTLGSYLATGGAFYGTKSMRMPNKILHSYVLGSYFCEILDPYLESADDELRIYKNYGSESYEVIGDFVPSSYKARTYPLRLKYIGDGYGSFLKLDDVNFGSSKAGLCSSIYWPESNNSVAEILVRTPGEEENQFYKVSFMRNEDYVFSKGNVGLMLLPNSGYTPIEGDE